MPKVCAALMLTSRAHARVEERLPPFPVDDCPQQNPRHAKSPENRECVLGDFLGEFGFRFSPSLLFRSAPDSGGQEKTKIPRQFVSRDSGLVGAEGFEPSAFCSRSKRATRLRYAPTLGVFQSGKRGIVYAFLCWKSTGRIAIILDVKDEG